MLEVVDIDGIHVCGTMRNLLVCLWRDTPTLEALDGVLQATRALIARCPTGIGVLGVAPGDMPLVGGAARRRAVAMLAETGGHVRCMATVIEGSGFRAGATRSVMSAITLLARQPCPAKIFGDVDEAATWQARLLGTHDLRPTQPRELCDAVAAARARLACVPRPIPAARSGPQRR
jgi:hypothetical protein